MRDFCTASSETDLKNHFHASSVSGYGKAAEAKGVLYCNCHLWMQKIMETFAPENC